MTVSKTKRFIEPQYTAWIPRISERHKHTHPDQKKTVLELRTALVQHVQVKIPIKSESSMGVSLFYPLLKPLGNNM